MTKKIIEKYIFEGFGFPIILRNIVVDKHNGEEFPDIDYNELELSMVKALIASPQALNGSHLKFLRKFMKTSLRDIADELGVSHAQIKNWEDNVNEQTGMLPEIERRFKNLTLSHLIALEQKVLSGVLIDQKIIAVKSYEPFDPDKIKLKYG